MTGPNPRPRRLGTTQNRRTELAAIAATLFHARGFHGVSLSDVTAQAGMTAPAIYRHFHNKQDLLLSAITYALDGVEEALDRARDESFDGLVLSLADAAIRHRELWVLLQRELKFADIKVRTPVEARFRSFVVALEGRIGHERRGLAVADRALIVTALLAALSTPSVDRHSVSASALQLDLASIAGGVARTRPPIDGPSSPPPPTPSSRTRDEQLLDRAIELFAARGYPAVSLDGIGAEVGIAGPSIYHHFETKADLLVAAFRRAGRHLSTDHILAEADPATRLSALQDNYIQLALTHRDLFAVYVDESVNLPRDEARQIAAALARDIDLWVSTLRSVRPELTVPAARLRVNAARGVVNDLVRFRRIVARPLIREEIRALSTAALRSSTHAEGTSGYRGSAGRRRGEQRAHERGGPHTLSESIVEETSMADTRWALVAGGSGGVGAATVRRLAIDGWNVAVGYRGNRDAAESAAAYVRSAGRSAATAQLDLTDAARTAHVVTNDIPGPLGAVVYAAGPYIPMRYISELPPERYREQILGDTVAAYNLLQPAIAPLRETSGSMVALVTPAIHHYSKKDMLSSSPKAAVAAFVRGIAAEEGRYGVRANCVGVGLLEGDGMWEQLVARGDYTPELLETARRNLALGRFGDVEDIAGAVRYLLSDEARWITGQTLDVDGGYGL